MRSISSMLPVRGRKAAVTFPHIKRMKNIYSTPLLISISCFHHTTLLSQPAEAKDTSSGPPKLGDAVEKFALSLVLGVATGLICALLFACLIRFFVRYINRTPILKGPVVFSPQIAPHTLQSALALDNQLLGSSPGGSYYKTVLENGLSVAVKRLEPLDGGSPEAHGKSAKRRAQQQELEMLAGLKHRNLMSLRAFVREKDRFSLVYDYAPNGSLADVMSRVRENELQLGWDVRLRIAVGIVRGLEYLHFSCTPQILHHRLKPANVILDADFEPRLGDTGLAKLLPKPNSSLDTATSGGYTAPECFQDCRYTDKSDVFSFGVILGVLLTGRDPMDPFFGEATNGGSLGRWLQHLQQAGEAREALDKSILGEEGEEEDEMVMAVKIAVVCLSDQPADRPSSDELVSMLTQLHSF